MTEPVRNGSVAPSRRRLFACSRGLARNDADAADLVQEAYLRAFRYFHTYRDGDAKSWVLRIVRRTCYSWLDRNRPANVVALETAADLDRWSLPCRRPPAIPRLCC